MHINNKLILLACVLATALWLLLNALGVSQPIVWTASITLFTGTLWVTEAIPIPAASLIPFAAFPLAGVLDYKQAASALGSHVILLLMGAFMLSKSLEKSGVHHRFALYMLKLTGHQSAKRLVLGFMLTAAILSMWISNSATTLMLLPIALAMISYIDNPKVVTALLLGIAYAASLGGVGTPIGTPPNVIFMSVYQQTQGHELSFLDWMKTSIPIVLIGIPLMALWLTRGLGKLNNFSLPSVGTWQAPEKRVIAIFAIVALAWILRPQWTQWLNVPQVGDSSIALAGVAAMFLIPSGKGNEKLLDWPTANSIPWGMLLLFAGGICIAKAFTASGLNQELAVLMEGLSQLPIILIILAITLIVTFLTEITSNTATATLLMPILAVAGTSAGVDPILLMVPAAISASCAFMLPVATAPNAIVYGTEKLSIKDMAREGAVLNVMIALVVTLVCYFSLN